MLVEEEVRKAIEVTKPFISGKTAEELIVISAVIAVSVGNLTQMSLDRFLNDVVGLSYIIDKAQKAAYGTTLFH